MAAGLLAGALYIAVAIFLFVLVGAKLPQGPRRTFLRATVIALFFSMTLIVGHGVAPFPALPIFIGCLVGGCERMYGPFGFIPWVLFPLLIQWAILVGIFFGWHAVTKGRTRSAPPDRAPDA